MWKTISSPMWSAITPKTAEAIPLSPNVNPKKIPAIIPVLAGASSSANTKMAEKAEEITKPTRMASKITPARGKQQRKRRRTQNRP